MGFGAFLILVCVVLAMAGVAVLAINYFLPNAPKVAVTIVWGVALFIILYTLAAVTGLLGHDVPIPRIR